MYYHCWCRKHRVHLKNLSDIDQLCIDQGIITMIILLLIMSMFDRILLLTLNMNYTDQAKIICLPTCTLLYISGAGTGGGGGGTFPP